MSPRGRHPGAAEFVPDTRSLAELADAARSCRGCDLFEAATQTVFGRGPRTARLVLVGEQPGDVEDVEGKAFVGPAGRVLDEALAAAGLTDTPTYTTNAVKHFRFTQSRGSKRRIHEKPTAGQSTACRPWLIAELASIRPRVLVALGATAAASLFGSSFRLTAHRGEVLDWPPETGDFAGTDIPVEFTLATIHPSAVLRAPDADRRAVRDGLVADLELAARLL